MSRPGGTWWWHLTLSCLAPSHLPQPSTFSPWYHQHQHPPTPPSRWGHHQGRSLKPWQVCLSHTTFHQGPETGNPSRSGGASVLRSQIPSHPLWLARNCPQDQMEGPPSGSWGQVLLLLLLPKGALSTPALHLVTKAQAAWGSWLGARVVLESGRVPVRRALGLGG